MIINKEKNHPIRFETYALEKCVRCLGTGLIYVNRSKFGKYSTHYCRCIFRRIFDIVIYELKYSDYFVDNTCRINVNKIIYYADIYLIAKRYLNDIEFKIFKYFFLLNKDYKYCINIIKTDRGQFFHFVYTIKEKLGRYFILEKIFPYFEYQKIGLKLAA